MFYNYFSEGLKAFQNKQYKVAKDKFEFADALNSTDGPTKLFLDRCDEVLNLPIVL